MQISQHIVVKKNGNKYYPKYSCRITKGTPALASNEIAIKIQLTIPDAIFDKPALQASIVIPDEAVSKPVINAEIVDNVQEIIKQNLGFEVTLHVVEKDEIV